MTRMVSIGAKVVQVSALLGTKDLNDWESGFVRSLVERSHNGQRTDLLTERQVETLARIWDKHFA